MREYLLTILIAALVTYLLTPVVRRFAVWFGAQAAPRDRDVHVIPTPRLGGLAMFGGMVAALAAAGGCPRCAGCWRTATSTCTGRCCCRAG
ncbi:hypothetical protein [Actinomadura keratinilytica]|uniref:hypothetical protein n=1 Tax=Actinomadura keratinilytica TaxID=547461 RepID=UPI003623EA94